MYSTAEILIKVTILTASSKYSFFLNFSFLKNLFIYFWLCWVFVAMQGFSLVAARRLLIAVASLVAEHGF